MKSKQPLKKRLLALLLSLCMMVGMIPLGGMVLAADATTDIWDGATAADFAGGDGSEENPYQISTGAQLAYLSEQVSGGEEYDGKQFVLNADLNLNHRPWLPIGSLKNAFRGSFDGQGHTISNLTVADNGTDPRYLGLFGVFIGETMKNLRLHQVKIISANALYTGSLAGQIGSMARVENCHAEHVSIETGAMNGGLVGVLSRDFNLDPTEGRVLGCTVKAVSIVQTKSDGHGYSGGMFGGIAPGNKGDSYLIENCWAEGAINVAKSAGENDIYASAGGLFGKIDNGWYDADPAQTNKRADITIRGCGADVSIEASGLGYTGGLIAEGSLLTLEDCRAMGTVNGGALTGGLYGYGDGLVLTDCSSSGDVSGAWSVGGLVGGGTSNSYKNCHATGDVTATDWHVGGLVGYGPKSKLERCFATGDVTVHTAGWASRAGGLLGNGFDSTVENCFALGDVTGSMGDVGGLVGWVSNADDSATAGSFTNCFSFGKIMESESDDLAYAKPLVNGIWDSTVTSAKVVNCYYNAETSGREDSHGTNKTLEEFADGTVLELLDGDFVQIENAACPTLPIEWNGYPKTFEEGLYYRIPEGKTVRSDVEAGFNLVTLPSSSALEVLGVWEIGRRQTVNIHGQTPCGENGKVVMTAGKTLSVLNVYGSIGKLEALGGSTAFYSGSEIGKATVNLPFDDSVNAYDQLNSNGAVGELTLQSGLFFNNNNATIQKAAVLGGELHSNYLRYEGFENLPNPPVIEEAEVKGGSLYQYNVSDAANEGTPYENPARIKKLTMDMRYPDSKVYNSFGGIIEEATLDGNNVSADDPENTAVFDNYKGGVVNKLTIEGDAGSHIYNRNDTEYDTPVVKEVTTDGGYCKIYNDNGGLIEKAAIWYNSELVNNRRAVVKNAYIHESNVRNTFHSASNTGGVIEKLYTTDSSSINNWAPARIGEIYAHRPEGSSLFISDVTEEDPIAEGGTVDKVYYRLQPDKGTPGTFTFGDNSALVSDAGEAFNAAYGLSDAQVGFQFIYTGEGKLSGVRMNGTELTAGIDGAYSFTMPQQNAILSVSDRALKGDATLSGLTYSVNGGESIPVPEFAASNGSYSITLPRETPRDATVTLSGVTADADARITAFADGKLVYGATEYEAPASLTVKAEDGSEKTYQVFFYTDPVHADMQDAAVGGIGNGDTFIQNQTPVFMASSSGMENDNPAVDDERYRPVSWKIDDGEVLSGTWDGAPFTGNLDLSKLSKGAHTLTVTYNWEGFGKIYENDEPTGEYGWNVIPFDLPEYLTKTVSFTVNPVTYTLKVVNGTDKTSGSPYEAGAEVSIEAAVPPAGYVFDKWVLTSGTGVFEDNAQMETTFTMGAGDTTVTATYKDVEAPTGEITIAAIGWKEFLNTVTFDLFYQDSQDVTITASDTTGEAVTIEYFLSAEALTLDEVQGKTQGWAAYNGKFSVDPDKEFIVYARLTDAAGNVTYLSSDGVVLDATAPVIAGIGDGKTYNEAKSVTVTDVYLMEVKLDGADQTIDQNMSIFTLTENGSYTITAKDKAGNEATTTVTIDIPPETYVLTLDADGGLPIPPVQTLEAGKKPAKVENPEKDGYTFLGWYDGDTKVDLNTFTMPEVNITLTAKWKKNVTPPTTTPSNPSDAPQTGDDFPVWPFWLAFLSLCGIGGALLSVRRRRTQEK